MCGTAHRELLESAGSGCSAIYGSARRKQSEHAGDSTQLTADQAALHNEGRREFEMIWGELKHYLKGFSVYGKREMDCGLGFAQDVPRTLLTKHTRNIQRRIADPLKRSKFIKYHERGWRHV